ncbi:hypothetical protein RKD48_007500 [Streptomyces ambofaciens]
MSSTSADQSSYGTDRYVGRRWSRASKTAWASARGTSPAHAGSAAQPTSGFIRAGASTLARLASGPMAGRTCCPATTTSGVREATAFVRAPIALPEPEAACRLTSTGRPVAWA